MILNAGAWDTDVYRKYREIAPLDPAPAAFVKLEPGTVSTSSRILSREVLERGAFVNEFFYPIGFEETLGTSLFAERSRFAILGLVRGFDRPDFDDREIDDLGLFVPHLIRAVQLRRAFVDLQEKSAGFQDVIERLAAGVVLLDRAGAAFFVNRAARAIFSRQDGISLDRMGRPIVANSTARRKFDDVLAATCRGGPGGVMAVPRKELDKAYAILVAPTSSTIRDWFDQQTAKAGALILIHDPASRPQHVADILQSALGLRPGAAKLVEALVADGDLQSYAERSGLTIHTARFHLRSAFAQTQTRTQVELVRRVVSLLRDLALRAAP